MELYDYLMQFLLENCSIKDDEFDVIRWSIIVAVMHKQYFLINDDAGQFIGFLTWEIRQSENDDRKIDLGINNLVIGKKHRGKFDIHRITNILRQQYPNMDKFVWRNRKKKELKEFKQKDNSCLSIS